MHSKMTNFFFYWKSIAVWVFMLVKCFRWCEIEFSLISAQDWTANVSFFQMFRANFTPNSLELRAFLSYLHFNALHAAPKTTQANGHQQLSTQSLDKHRSNLCRWKVLRAAKPFRQHKKLNGKRGKLYRAFFTFFTFYARWGACKSVLFGQCITPN